jgi:hypothetical protein
MSSNVNSQVVAFSDPPAAQDLFGSTRWAWFG